MIFHTKSGSVYQLDIANKRVRRLHGQKPATSRQGNNEWRTYQDIFPEPIKVGHQVIIAWTEDVALLPETVREGLDGAPTTITSPVVSLEVERT